MYCALSSVLTALHNLRSGAAWLNSQVLSSDSTDTLPYNSLPKFLFWGFKEGNVVEITAKKKKIVQLYHKQICEVIQRHCEINLVP